MEALEAAPPTPGLRARISEFFYAPEIPYGLAIVRIILPIGLLFAMGIRWPHARELYSSDGAPVGLWNSYSLPALFPEPSGDAAVAIHTILILTLATACIGWCTRLSMILATSGYIFLNMLDAIGTMNKYSVIASHMLFLLCFSQCGAVWSVDHWLVRSRLRRQGIEPALADRPGRFSAVPRRLMQLMIASVYIGAATTKMHTPVYFTGEQIQTWMITAYNVPNPFGSRLALEPALVIAFAYVTVAWEILFIFIAWRGISRIVMLAIGSIFHLMTLFTLGLWVFPIVCIAAYFAFLNETDVERIRGLLTRWRARGSLQAAFGRLNQLRLSGTGPALDPAWSHGIFCGVAVLLTFGGVGLEHKLDPYGIRRPEGPYQLKELSPERVTELIRSSERIRNQDKFLTFNTGSVIVGGALLDHRTEFHMGDTVWVECGLMPPHEDLWIECNLQDAENRVIVPLGVFVPADALRTNFYYRLQDEVGAGQYSVVMKISGEEVIRRPITILPKSGRPLAN